MLRWAVRAILVRGLGRRVIPVLLLVDAIQLVRQARRRWTDPGTGRE